jgi:hypothetical protein
MTKKIRLEEITKQQVSKMLDSQLLALRYRACQLWEKHFKNSNVESVGCLSRKMVIRKSEWIIDEISRRPLERSTMDLDRQIFKKKIQVKNDGVDLYSLTPMTLRSHLIVLTKSNAKNDEAIKIIVRADETPILKSYEKMLREAVGADCEIVYDPNFVGICFPLCSTQMVSVNKMEQVTIGSQTEVTNYEIRLLKADEDQEERIVYGIVYEPDVTDSQGDRATAEEIRKAAYEFMEAVQTFKVNHQGMPVNIRILESYLAPDDFEMSEEKISKGTWLLAVRVIDDNVWEGVKNGELTGYSMAGVANAN